MLRPVIILNAVEHVQLAVARSLFRQGIRVTVVDINGDHQFPSNSRAIARMININKSDASTKPFVETISELVRTEGHDMLIPCGDPGLVAVSQCYYQLRSLLYVGCPPPHVSARALNKDETLDAARKCGISIPITYRIKGSVDLERMRKTLRFPLIAKPASKIDEHLHAFKARCLPTYEDLVNQFQIDPRFGDIYLLQEYCRGVGVGIEVLIHHGEPVAIFQHRRLKELPASGGGSVMAISEQSDRSLSEQAITLLRQIGWEGVAMVEFRQDKSLDKTFLMEVNGRYWGSLPLAIKAGMDFPFFEWQLAHGQKPQVPAAYRTGIRTRWLCGDIRRLQDLLTQRKGEGLPEPALFGEVIRFFRDFLPPIHPAIWSWSDPLPALYQLRATLRKVIQDWSRSLRVAQYRALSPREIGLLVRRRVLYTVGLIKYSPPGDLSNVESILFVCQGNILRSPMAAALLDKHLAKAASHPLRIVSAGLSENPQSEPDKRAEAAAKEFGIELKEHRPKRLTSEMVRQADLVFIMDRFNEVRMLETFPEARTKTFMLASLNDGRHRYDGVEIPDPGLGDIAEVRQCYLILEELIRKLAHLLQCSSKMNCPESRSREIDGSISTLLKG